MMERSRNYHEPGTLDHFYEKSCDNSDRDMDVDVDVDVDVEDPDDSLAARIQRDHMLELYSGDHPELKLAYEDWERTYGLLERRVERGTAVGSFAKKEICHLFGVFVVVEGVLLVTLAQANLLTCENWWICFYLSFLASIVLLIPLVQRLTAFWTVRNRVASLLVGMEVLARRIHLMKTMGPIECAGDAKSEDALIHDILKKPGVSSTIMRASAISIAILASVVFLMLAIQVRCEGSLVMPQRLQTFLKFAPVALNP